MRGFRRGWCAAAVTAIVLGAGTPASGRTAAPINVNVTASGSLAITWQGDPARGCAAEGLCGIHGELILKSFGSAGFGSSAGLSGLPVNLSGTVRVRDDSRSPAGECVDQAGNSYFAPGPGIQLNHGRGWAATLNPPASSGRCAGPLASDLSRLTLPVRGGGGRYPTFDLRGRRVFGAGPFTGTVVSTMVVRTSPAGGASGGSSTVSSASGFGSGSVPRSLVEYVDLRYRVSFLPSTLEANFAGATDPVCQAFDDCQTTGSLSVSLARGPANVTLSGSRVVRARVSARRALQDLVAGRVTVDSPAFVSVPANVTETFTRSGAACHEALRVSGLGVAFGLAAAPTFGPGSPPPPGNVLPISLQNNGLPNADVLRTHCPGPADADTIGGSGTLAAGSMRPSELLRRGAEVSLTNPGPFSGLGYAGSRNGAIKLELTLTHVDAGTKEEPR